MAGNEDCGQMSAWYVLSAIGFYAVDPASTHYVFGSPLFDRVTLELAAGHTLVFEAKRQSPKSVYIESVELNGKSHANAWFAHADVASGGRFVFHLTDQPEGGFGQDKAVRPVSGLALTS
jgi:putative alpha-1,2-mannosidase